MRNALLASLAAAVFLAAFAVPATALANELYDGYRPSVSKTYFTPSFLLAQDDFGDEDEDEDFFDGPKSRKKSRAGPPLDMFGFRPGIWQAYQDGQIRIDKGGVEGTPQDLGPDLGLDMAKPTVWYELFFQVEWSWGAIRLEPSYIYQRYEGNEVADIGEPPLILDGWTFPAGTEWDSEWDVAIGKLNARLTPLILRADWFQFRMSIYGGSAYQRYYLRMKLTNNPGNIGDRNQVKDEYSAVIGHVGGHFEFRFSTFWFYFWFSGMQFDRNELSANYYEYGLGIKYEVFPWFLVNIEGFGFRSRLDRNDQFRVDQAMYGPAFFLIFKI